jgi:light-regulated signal transduction histidine kinase (bacteriophytochrome)
MSDTTAGPLQVALLLAALAACYRPLGAYMVRVYTSDHDTRVEQAIYRVVSLGDRVELRVIDRGPGLAPADLERVFTPFQRLGDTDNTTGIGLGLALSRGVTEAMGGTLTPEETPGGGLTMVVSMPAAPTPDEHAAATEPGLRERAQDRAGATASPVAGQDRA